MVDDKDDDLGLSLALKCPDAFPHRPLNLFLHKKALPNDAFHHASGLLFSLVLMMEKKRVLFLVGWWVRRSRDLIECLICRDQGVPERHRRESGAGDGGL